MSLEKELQEYLNSFYGTKTIRPDYTTNSKSYYDYLEKVTAVLIFMSKKIDDYDGILTSELQYIKNTLDDYLEKWDENLENFDDSVLILLQKWMDDGTFEHIINHEIFKNKLDTSIFEQFERSINQQLPQKVGLGKKAELEDLSAEVLSAIEGGEGTEFNLLSIPQDYSVTPIKTNFAVGGDGVNVWDGRFTNLYMSANEPFRVLEGDTHLSIIVKLIPSTEYIFWKSNDTDRFMLGFFSEYPNIDSIPTNTYFNNSAREYVYTTSATEEYALLHVSSSTESKIPNQLQVELGSSKSDYVKPHEKIIINLSDKSIPPIKEEMTTFFEKNVNNLWGGTWENGFISANDPYRLIKGTGGKHTIVKVSENETYTITRELVKDYMAVAVFDSYPDNESVPLTATLRIASDPYTLTTGDIAQYLVIQNGRTSDVGEGGDIQIEQGSLSTGVDPLYTIPAKYTSKTGDSIPPYQLSHVWGHEYLYSWYKRIAENEDLTMVWSGDSTTLGSGSWEEFRRHNLGKKIMTLGGYPTEKITSINSGHGTQHTGNWLGGVYDDDKRTENGFLDEDMQISPDLYVLAWGINDGSTNHFPEMTWQERIDGFEFRLREGLERIRGSVYNKTPDDLAIIICTPNSTNATATGQINRQWQDKIRPLIKKACRDYNCAFVDIGARQYDHEFSNSWSTNDDRVHPTDIANADYMSMFSDLLFPLLMHK